MGTSQTPNPVHGYERIAHALSRYLGVSEVLKRHESNLWTYYLMHMVRELLRGYLAVGLEKFPGLLRNALATSRSVLDESLLKLKHTSGTRFLSMLGRYQGKLALPVLDVA